MSYKTHIASSCKAQSGISYLNVTNLARAFHVKKGFNALSGDVCDDGDAEGVLHSGPAARPEAPGHWRRLRDHPAPARRTQHRGHHALRQRQER